MTDHKVDISVVEGPGTWRVIHTQAIRAKTSEKKKAFNELMNDISHDFGCIKCRSHAQTYISQNPISDYYNVINDKGEDIGMFKWSWVFHNTVNKRLGKSIIDFDTAYSLYTNNKGCNKYCAAGDPDNEKDSNSHDNKTNEINNNQAGPNVFNNIDPQIYKRLSRNPMIGTPVSSIKQSSLKIVPRAK